jgi:hypothetical protein
MKKEIKKENEYKIHLVSRKIMKISEKDYLRIVSDVKKGQVNWIQVGSEDGLLINASNVEVIEIIEK